MRFWPFATAAALLVATSAQAAPVVLSFTGGNTGTNGADGNAMTFQAGSGADIVKVRVTAWSNSGTLIRDSYLGDYAQGLGVTSDDENGSGNTHVIDNQNLADFVLLQFDRPVSLSSITLNTFSVNGNTADSDAIVGWGTVATAWTSALNLNNVSSSVLDSLLQGEVSVPGTGASGARSVPDGGAVGNLWLIGAASPNPDRYIDGFKIGSITVTSAVPEPSTWLMMLLGFGAVGFAMRRRRSEGRAIDAVA